MKKNRSPPKMKEIKTNQMEILKLKNTTKNLLNSIDELNSRKEGGEWGEL